MARGVIGLDVGTSAVTVAEVIPGTPPKLVAFGQVALASDVMREGEIVDGDAVTGAIARLRTELGLRRAKVRVGVASPRLIVRQVEMPVMTREELAGALRFQAQELIPIPLDEAVIDFAILGTVAGENGESVMQVLLAAAHSATVSRLVEAVEGAGLGVESVDLIPLALIRSLAHAVSDNGAGAEGITLTAADTLVRLQRSWSLIEHRQAEDRVHRPGAEQHESIHIIDIVAADTVEEAQVDAVAGKGEMLEQITRDQDVLRRLLCGK
jgi:type IV pilus assembly protein PilM